MPCSNHSAGATQTQVCAPLQQPSTWWGVGVSEQRLPPCALGFLTLLRHWHQPAGCMPASLLSESSAACCSHCCFSPTTSAGSRGKTTVPASSMSCHRHNTTGAQEMLLACLLSFFLAPFSPSIWEARSSCLIVQCFLPARDPAVGEAFFCNTLSVLCLSLNSAACFGSGTGRLVDVTHVGVQANKRICVSEC